MEKLLEELGFEKSEFVGGRYSVADLFKPKERCGIYVLHFKNGQFYVGLATDFVRRYNQHKKNHLDIERVSFKKIKKEKLSEEEKLIVQTLQSEGFSLRNIQLVSIVEGETDFDLLMSVGQQEEFISDLAFNNMEGDKFEIEEQRIKYTNNFLVLSKLPYFEKFIQAIKAYVKIGIPIPKKSEYSFWCVSVPSRSSKLSRININWQEVSTYVFEKDDFHVTFHMAYSPLVAEFGEELDGLFEQFEDLEIMVNDKDEVHTYEPGGQDQVSFVIPSSIFHNFIAVDAVQKAIKTFNLRLMRKGATIYNRYHSFDLSRRILDN
jgi:GIY-YIG catalytic domain